MKSKSFSAFTLIELLIVIGILGVMAVIVLVAINPGQKQAQARDTGRISGVSQLGHAVEGNQIAKQRNVALKHSSGTILYLLDDDSRVHRNSFKILAKEFSSPKVAAVGGPSLTKKESEGYFNDLMGYTLETYFGAMRMRFRYGKQNDQKGSEYRLIGANLALRKSAVTKVGKFNENIVPNEETELLRRLSKAGFELKYNKKLSIYRNHRKNIFDLAKQFHHYGVGRMKQFLHNFSLEDILFIVPISFFLYLATLIFFHPFWYLIPLLLYIFLGVATSLKASIKYKRPDLLLTMLFIFPIIHLSYAVGLLHEFLFKREQKGKPKGKVSYISKIKVITPK